MKFKMIHPKNVPQFLYHRGIPTTRKSILKAGLIPFVGESYELHWMDYIEKKDLPPGVFLFMPSNGESYSAGYDDDVYRINTQILDKDSLFLDPETSLQKTCFFYTKRIPASAIELIYKGTGEDGDNYEAKGEKRMKLGEALKYLENKGFVCEDTDELDDADLPIGMKPKAYHAQKAKMMSLADKVKMALNQQTEENIKKAEEVIPENVLKMAKQLDKKRRETFSGDYKGDHLLGKDKEIDKQYKKLSFRERCIKFFKEGYDRHSNFSFKRENCTQKFLKHWLPQAEKLKQGKKITVYRGISLDSSKIKKDPSFYLALIKRNMCDRNSWTYNRDAAASYSDGNGDISLIVEMQCSVDLVNLYYSAWLEGYWAGWGSYSSRSAGNDEINLKQMMNVMNVKITYAFTYYDESNKLAAKYLGITESALKETFMKGEGGGASFMNMSNDYSYEDAKKCFASAIIGESRANDPEYLSTWWDNYCTKNRKLQFEKTYNQFEQYRKGEPIKLYRGLVVKDGEPLDLENAGECWSFSKPMTNRWVDGIYDSMVHNHVVNGAELEKCKKYILCGTTDINNCRLPYSFWLAGRFERPEWEIRVKDEAKVSDIKYKEIE